VEEHGFSCIPGDPLVLAFQESFPDLGIGHQVADMSAEEAYASTCKQFGRFLVQLGNALAWESPIPYVIDTFHLRPDALQGIDDSKTTVLFLGYPDVDPLEKARRTQEYQIASYGKPHGWAAVEITAVVEKFELFIRMSQRVREQCECVGITFLDTGSDFARAITEAVGFATGQNKRYE